MPTSRRTRDLALFNLAGDSKLRGCEGVSLKVSARRKFSASRRKADEVAASGIRSPNPSSTAKARRIFDLFKVARRKLRCLNSSWESRVNAGSDLGDLRSAPSNRLEGLAGDRKGQHSIRIFAHQGTRHSGTTLAQSAKRL
jgi:plasmid maintenance system killer protein